MDRRLLVLVVLASAGCRQIFGLDDLIPADASSDAHVQLDAPIDTLAPADCMTRWRTTPVFGTSVPLTILDTGADEGHPFLSPDERTMYFTRASDLYVATRATLQDPFGDGVLDTSLSTASNEGKAFINFDGTRAFFSSDQPNGSGGFDLWRGSRAANSGPFSVDRMYVSQKVDDDKSQVDPHMSTDLLRLYYIPSAGPMQHIAIATRGTTSQDFQNVTSIAELAGSGADAGPTLTEDETVIVFSSTRSGGEHLFYATRTTSGAAFTMPKPLPQVGSAAIDTAPHVSRDGCRVYFSSTRDGSADLFVAAML